MAFFRMSRSALTLANSRRNRATSASSGRCLPRPGKACLPFFFGNVATFISLGFVLRPMVGELHWSFTQAGASFSVLGLACGLSSPLPAWTMKRYGGRLTLCVGSVLFALGFLAASAAHGLYSFYAAMALVGVGLAVGAATSVTGAVSFIGLAAPHLVRPLVGHQPSRTLLPSASNSMS